MHFALRTELSEPFFFESSEHYTARAPSAQDNLANLASTSPTESSGLKLSVAVVPAKVLMKISSPRRRGQKGEVGEAEPAGNEVDVVVIVCDFLLRHQDND